MACVWIKGAGEQGRKIAIITRENYYDN